MLRVELRKPLSRVLPFFLLAHILAGCVAAQKGGDILFGETNPYSNPEIEVLIPGKTVNALYTNLNTSFSDNSSLDTNNNFKLPDERYRCISISSEDEPICVISETETKWSNTKGPNISTNHPYFVSLRNASRICSSPLFHGLSEDRINEAKIKCSIARERLIGLYLDVADRACIQRLASIGSGRASTNLFMRFTNITSSAVATFAGVASTARWLSALSLASSETGALLNDEVFSQAINHTMATKIVEEQQKYRKQIMNNLKKSPDDYRIDAALNDARLYNRQCSYAYGQALLTGVGGAATTDPSSVEGLEARIDRLQAIQLEIDGELTEIKDGTGRFTSLDTAAKEAATARRQQRLNRVEAQIGVARDQLIATSR
ncbi:hypothetical protein [Pyruvatibacter mobilis]|uniref:hypothetical protein n=1 Tax=Pyruvatibacter mobilis TaxID=1712261 RepID=UPI003BB0DC06